MFFLQMSGVPGAGKSTLARAISKRTGAVVIDHDVVKSALLDSWESELDPSVAGKVAYDIEWALVDFHLSQGHSVILDSPCLYTVMVEKGTAVAKKYNVDYKYVECCIEDFQAVDLRLQTRSRMRSQNSHVSSEEVFRTTFANSKRPADVPCLMVDSAQPFESYFDEVLAYLHEGAR